MGRLILLLVLLAVPGLAFAEAPGDSAASQGEAPAGSVQVILGTGETLIARSVRPAPFDMIAVVMLDSSVRYIPAVRIRRILDSEGNDQTKAVFDRRTAVEQVRPGDPPRPTRIPAVTWRGRPHPATKSFLITEFGVMQRLDPYPWKFGGSRLAITFDVGWMKNVSTRSAVGFSGYAMPSDETTRLGIRGRYRRWLSRRLSLDVSPGVILGGEDAALNYDAPGYVLGATLNAGDLIAVMVDAEVARSWTFAEEDPPFLTRETHTDVTWRAGAKIGSGLGLAASVGLIDLVIVALSSGSFE